MTFLFVATSSFITSSAANFVPVSGAVEGMFKFKELLKTAGWVVTASSDGVVSFSTSSDIITTYTGVLVSGTAITGSLGNKSAWFVMASPSNPSGNGTDRQFWSFQRDSTNNGTNFETWRIKYSADMFDNLTASLTSSPGPPNGATVSQSIMLGGGTDAAPTFAVGFRTSGNMRWNSAANNASPYEWYTICTEFTAYQPVTMIMHDAMLTGSWPDSGTFPTQFDQSPYCAMVSYFATATDATVNLQSSTLGPFTWFRKGTNFVAQGSGILRLQGLKYMGSNAGNTTLTNAIWPSSGTTIQSRPGLNSEALLPIPYGRRVALLGAATGYKGLSNMMKYPAAPRTNGSTYNGVMTSTGSKDGIKFGLLVFPWNGQSYLY